ncbi:PQQ-dependent sugar dehydrogenase [Prauserella cavernicola]|uniref:PQQ-dependent sugar dehydrogenase n=1 Tax=Prauserella cavernicola TaxID=2800127 RepID=UPI0027DD9C13|nr:PQQ-dependent sugar dehydrogenase [Prauserella cavernicola]
MALTATLLTGTQAAAQADDPILDPIPEDPVTSGLGLTVEEVAQFPKSETTPEATDPRIIRHARINHLGELPDGSGRKYVPDLNGNLYFLGGEGNGDEPEVYLDVKAQFPDFFSGKGMGQGFGFVTFDPEFESNGVFYTVHTEAGAALEKETTYPEQPGTQFHGIVTQWTADDPAADEFSGSSREMLRFGFAQQIHGIQQIDFNSTAAPGDEDYGLLYVAVGDGGLGVSSTEPQELNTPHGKILRIDPDGTDGPNGQYGVPDVNPFVGQDGALGEIFAYGMRDPHRFSWDPQSPHRMYLGHIGQRAIESIYEVQEGDNLGWSEREGTFRFKRDDGCYLYALPEDDDQYDYVYPVAQYDHNPPPDWDCGDVGRAVSGGFVYRGEIPELQGKYLFADLVDGRVFFTESGEMQRGQDPATISTLMIYDEDGNRVSMPELAGDDRVDLRFGRDADGELYLLSKANGKLWKVTGAKNFADCTTTGTSVNGATGKGSWAPVTPEKWRFPGREVVLAEAGDERPGPRRPYEYAVLSKGKEYGSVRLDVKVRLDTPVEETNRDVVLVFGHRSDTEFYYAHLSTDNSIYAHNGIFKVDNGDRERLDDQWNETLSRGAAPAITDAEWHDVRVTHCASTGEIAVYVDGEPEPVMTAVDSTFTSGRVGFGSFDNVGRLKDLHVTGTRS